MKRNTGRMTATVSKVQVQSVMVALVSSLVSSICKQQHLYKYF